MRDVQVALLPAEDHVTTSCRTRDVDRQGVHTKRRQPERQQLGTCLIQAILMVRETVAHGMDSPLAEPPLDQGAAQPAPRVAPLLHLTRNRLNQRQEAASLGKTVAAG